MSQDPLQKTNEISYSLTYRIQKELEGVILSHFERSLNSQVWFSKEDLVEIYESQFRYFLTPSSVPNQSLFFREIFSKEN